MRFQKMFIGMILALLLTGCHAAPPSSESRVALDMPESIVYRIFPYDGEYVLTIQGNGETYLTFQENEEEPTTVSLSEEEIVELNVLYGAIQNFTSLSELTVPDTTMVVDGVAYEFCMEYTTQVELEQYMRLLRSYRSGSEYDWRVWQYDGIERWNERMLPSAYKDMQDWVSMSQGVQPTDLPITEELDDIEAFDGNVYQYFAVYGMDYVRKDGDRYYACYRSEDELLTVWFDRQGTKMETARKSL